MSNEEKPVCGCSTGWSRSNAIEIKHSRKCISRGRDKMTSEEVEADLLKEKQEDAAEEAAELVQAAREKIESVLPIVKGALAASKEVRSMLPWQELADELRGLVATDLAPFGKLLHDAGAALLWESAKGRADAIKKLFEETGLPMEVCVQIVLVSSNDLSNALKGIKLTSESDKKK